MGTKSAIPQTAPDSTQQVIAPPITPAPIFAAIPKTQSVHSFDVSFPAQRSRKGRGIKSAGPNAVVSTVCDDWDYAWCAEQRQLTYL